MLKEFLTNIGVIKKSNVSPNNLLVNSYIYGIDDNRGPVSKDNLLINAEFVELPESIMPDNIEVEEQPQVEVE